MPESTIQLAKRIQSVTPSLTLAITAKAKRLVQEGVDVISLSAGEPDFDTPNVIKEAAIASLKTGFTKYTPAAGIPELRKAISEKLARENHLSYIADQVVISCGAKHAIYNVLQVLIEDGDEVIIPSPYWLSYPEMVTLAGGKSRFLKTTQADGFQCSIEQLESSVTDKTKALILNSPSNPTGVVFSREQLEAVAQVAKAHSFFIISDEIYEKLIYDGRSHLSIGSVDPVLLERTITVGGASKAYSMTGWRLGFAACPKPIAQACASLQSHSTSNPTSFSQVAYLEALRSGEAEVSKMRSIFEKRRDLIFQRVSQIKRLKPFKPGGAFYLFVDISDVKLRSIEFCDRLLEEAKVAAVPGVAFGDDHSIRLSFAASEDRIEAGVARLEAWVKKL